MTVTLKGHRRGRQPQHHDHRHLYLRRSQVRHSDRYYTSTSGGGIIGGGGGGGGEEPEAVELGDIAATIEQDGVSVELSVDDADLAAAVAAVSDGCLTVDLSGYEGVGFITVPAALAGAAAGASSV